MAETKLDDVEQLEACRQACEQICQEIGKRVIGQQQVIEELLLTILAGGHCLLVGVPGLAKTLLVSTLAQTLSLKFSRIQFTPDLMPADITGTEVLQDDPETRERRFKFLPGPLFANIVLADEINRTPPKTQAALLEAMQEQQITVGGVGYALEAPFFVLATQNPIEQEGTYPLPEAQLDRFMFFVQVKYPNEDEELQIMKQSECDGVSVPQAVLAASQLLDFQAFARRIPVADTVYQYARALIRATRPREAEAPEFIREWLLWGAGPRAAQHLIQAGRARAAFYGQPYVACEDIAAVCAPVLRHRLMRSFRAQSENICTDEIIRRLLESVPMYEEQTKEL